MVRVRLELPSDTIRLADSLATLRSTSRTEVISDAIANMSDTRLTIESTRELVRKTEETLASLEEMIGLIADFVVDAVRSSSLARGEPRPTGIRPSTGTRT